MKELRHINKAEERGPQNGKGSKKSEVLQQVSLNEEQSSKGANGGYTT